MKLIAQLLPFVDPKHAWLVEIALILLATALLSVALRRFVFRVIDESKETATPWTGAVARSTRRPLRLLVWCAGVGFASEVAAVDAAALLFRGLGALCDVGVIAALAWFLIQLIGEGEALYLDARPDGVSADPATVRTLGKLLRVIALVSAALIALQTFGFSVSGLLAFGGIGGIALGLAAKDLLANFFGGLMIYLDSPFEAGDWIRSPDRKIEGIVEAVGWRVTRIRSFDKRLLYVPNSVFLNVVLENPSRMTRRRVSETLSVRYEDIAAIPAITQEIKALLEGHEGIDQEAGVTVRFSGVGGSSLEVLVQAFTETINWGEYLAVKEALLLEMAAIITRHGAALALPTQAIHLSSEGSTRG